MLIDLIQMQPEESGVVAEIQGSCGLARRIQSMGVRPGKKITKLSSHFSRGPQTIKIGNMRIAVGFGMAKRVFVQVER